MGIRDVGSLVTGIFQKDRKEMRDRTDEERRFADMIRRGEQTVIDHLAPSALVEEPDAFQVGSVWGRAYFVADLPPGVTLNVETVLRFSGDTWWSWFIYPEPEEEIHPALKQRRTTLYGENILDTKRGALGSYSRDAELAAVEEGIKELELKHLLDRHPFLVILGRLVRQEIHPVPRWKPLFKARVKLRRG